MTEGGHDGARRGRVGRARDVGQDEKINEVGAAVATPRRAPDRPTRGARRGRAGCAERERWVDQAEGVDKAGEVELLGV